MWLRQSCWISVIILCASLAGVVQSVEAKETDTAEPIQGISASVHPDLFTGVLTTSVPLLVLMAAAVVWFGLASRPRTRAVVGP